MWKDSIVEGNFKILVGLGFHTLIVVKVTKKGKNKQKKNVEVPVNVFNVNKVHNLGVLFDLV